MRIQRVVLEPILIVTALAAWGCEGGRDPSSSPSDSARPRVAYFFDPDCPECHEVEELYLEPLAVRAGCPLELVERVNVTEPAGARRLLELQPEGACSALAPVLIVGQEVFCGVVEIRRAFEATLPGHGASQPADAGAERREGPGEEA